MTHICNTCLKKATCPDAEAAEEVNMSVEDCGEHDPIPPTCPYCEEHIKQLTYQQTNTGAVYSCPKCDTIITTEELEAYAFVNLIWDGTGDLDEMGFPPAPTRKEIGRCGVDAGCLIILDPCYIKYMPNLDKGWGAFCDTVLQPVVNESPNHGGQVHYGGGGVIVSTHGDGNFPVMATYDEHNRITKIEILVSRDESFIGRTTKWVNKHR